MVHIFKSKTQEIALNEVQNSVGQRIKFLMEHYNLSARNFSRALGVPDNNTQNYVSSNPALPKADYLEKIMHHFQSINPGWLLTGQGEPFLTPPTENTLPTTNAKKISRSQIVGTNHGTAYQERNTTPAGDEALKTKLTLAEKEIEHLRALLAAKDQTIEALKTAIRP